MSAIIGYCRDLFIRNNTKKTVYPSPEEELAIRLKPFERQLYKIQDIIFWKDSNLSIAAVFAVNLFFL